MTGGTLVVKKGNRFAMTKVAHDGYDLEEKLDQFKEWLKSCNAPEDIIEQYFKTRITNGDFDPYDPLQDKDLCIITREESVTWKEFLNKMDQELMNHPKSSGMSDEYDEEHPYNQLCCSHMDYILFIDMDAESAILNDEFIF